MSALRNQNIHNKADFVKLVLPIRLLTAISQTDKALFSFVVGYKFELLRARTFNSAKAGAVSGNVKIATRVAAPLVFTAATEVAAVLSTTKANVRGSATEAITIEYTTDGSGALTDGFVILELRPRPLAGDLGPT